MICENPPMTQWLRRSPWRDAEETPLMVELPAGEFVMGENDADKFANDTERPAHQVRIPAGSAIGVYPVTVGQFRAFAPDHAPRDAEDLPVVGASWLEAVAYCDWLSRHTGRNYRLPTESEWEYACRAGSQAPFAGGDEITPAQSNYLYDEAGQRVGPGQRTPVGRYPANRFGLHDLHGNVCEWVADTWHPNFIGAPQEGRAWTNEHDFNRVIRGGAWDYLPQCCRSAARLSSAPEAASYDVGFRVVLAPAR